MVDVLRVAYDVAIDPHNLLEAVRGPDGRLIDFVYREINAVACAQHGYPRADLIGRRISEVMQPLRTSGIIEHLASCVNSGTAIVNDDFTIAEESATRHFEIRAVCVGHDLIDVTWREITDRVKAAEHTARSETNYRLIAENSTDVVARFRRGVVTWVSPSVEAAFGKPPSYWVGRHVADSIPDDELPAFAEMLDATARGGAPVRRVRINDVHGSPRWVDVHIGIFYDADGQPDGSIVSARLVDEEVRAQQEAEESRRRRAEAEDRYRILTDNSAVPTTLLRPDGGFLVVNPAMCEFLGHPAETLLGMRWQEVSAAETLETDLVAVAALRAGEKNSYRATRQYLRADGQRPWGDLSLSCRRTADGDVDYMIAQIVDITPEVQAQQSVARYRRVMENSNVGMSLADAGGRFLEVNQAMCDLFGMQAADFDDKTWQALTPAEYLEADLGPLGELIAGRLDTHRVVKQGIHADGHLFWIDVSVSCLRNPDGDIEYFVAQVIDVTTQMDLRNLLQSELDSAARYIGTILPDDLDGPVRISSRYLPAQRLSGDCFDFDWIDDDHLLVYLIDVSGHGVEAALVSVSMHDMLRPGSLPAKTLLAPERVLAKLNQRFRMEQHSHHYATVWYGVYQPSTRTMTYAGAGHPPALMISPNQYPAPLWSQAAPLGMFDDTWYSSDTQVVPAGSQMLLYSDGAFEFTTPDGRPFGLTEFERFCGSLASAPDWSLDDLVLSLSERAADGRFEDDCSVVRLTF